MKLLKNKKFLGSGVGATLLCCFTPVLVILAGFFGLSWIVGYLDFGLTPLLGFFITALTLIYYREKKRKIILLIGGLALLIFTVLYLVWGAVLGLLVLAGAGVAFLTDRYLMKESCKTCEVKK